MTSAALRRPLSLVVAVAVATVVPVLTSGGTGAAAAPTPVPTALRSYGLAPTGGTAAAAPSTSSAQERSAVATPPAAQSRVVEIGGRAHVVGVTWPDGAVASTARVEIREERAGAWGAWQSLEAESDDGPDAGTPEQRGQRGGTAPWISTADAVQARVVGDATGGTQARLDVVDASTTAADEAVTSTPAGSASAAGTMPTILTRKDWGADESIRHAKLGYGEIKAAVVHHTVGSNTYSSSEVPSIIRGIYVFHTNGRDWGDIGYNFLVDRFGRTWEGRYGGMDQPVIGAHAIGVNSQSFGTSVMGDFTSAAVPSAVVTAQSKLIAWKLGLAHVDPTTTTTLDGFGTNPTVIGHRDVYATSCPGAQLYAKIPQMRTLARQYQGTMLYGPRISRTAWSYGGSGADLSARAGGAMTWTITVSSPCAGTVASLRGTRSAAGGFSVRWDGRDSSGDLALPGDYVVTMTGKAGSGSTSSSTVEWPVTIAATTGSPPGACPPRLEGSDRFAVAVAASKAKDPSTRKVVLTNGQANAMADALVAAPLAQKQGAVLLLTNTTKLPSATRAEIVRRKVTQVTVVGGEPSVSSAVVRELTSLGATVTRIGGATRFEVAANVARAVTGGAAAPDVLVASGRQAALADGLALSGPATRLGRPILLVDATVPAATRTALTTLQVRRTVVAGGAVTVPDTVLRALPSARRLDGANRYDLSANIATWARGAGVPTADVLVASGETTGLADTLSGGQLGRPTLYVRQAATSPSVVAWLRADPASTAITVLGAPVTVSLRTGGYLRAAVTP
ncbi:cell wall-binding repeat-containing protein [Phycicoccus sp. MAQZ13P-2]|uniref:cell wall-binding repeat-containing protein n=1 Tax=Phycicoccus mangrovi TaxID=2840470 RepID=UPI001C00582D|nr:cell wall-binding repeat-containing protein [Phycicoccus mangrovi]MBT9255953.1 cell wall-binding repeat-containing protein [Phycicoccus mangrovi]MBT9274547.1 cell wall-binding repeat-containing protein [Phycicoccus mangrovi]